MEHRDQLDGIASRLEDDFVRCEAVFRRGNTYYGCRKTALYTTNGKRRAYCAVHVPATAKTVYCLYTGIVVADKLIGQKWQSTDQPFVDLARLNSSAEMLKCALRLNQQDLDEAIMKSLACDPRPADYWRHEDWPNQVKRIEERNQRDLDSLRRVYEKIPAAIAAARESADWLWSHSSNLQSRYGDAEAYFHARAGKWQKWPISLEEFMSEDDEEDLPF